MRSLTILSLLAIAVAAHASDSATLLGLAPNAGSLNLTLVPPSGVLAGNFSAGPFNLSVNGGPTMEGYCADLTHFAVYNVPTPVTIVDTATMAAGYQQAARIVNKYYADADTEKERAALQGAIWKSIYGGDLTISDGTAGASALALSYVAEDLSAYSDHANYFNFGGANQSMIAPVPEPASVFALGVGAMGLLRRRRQVR